VTFFLSSLIWNCGDDKGAGPTDSVVGSWQCISSSANDVALDSDFVVEFRADGTGDWGNESIAWETSGSSITLSWLDEGSDESQGSFDVDGDSLTITASDDWFDYVFVFERVSG
jgi:hypothetical protein